MSELLKLLKILIVKNNFKVNFTIISTKGAIMNKYKILLIEDDNKAVIWIQNFLEGKGFEVDTFSNVIDSTSHILFNNYNLILLDLNLEDFSGYEILKYLKKRKLSIPVIVTSAYSEIEKKLFAFNLGADDYMVKPIDLKELEARIWIQFRKNHEFYINDNEKTFKIDNDTIFFKDKALELTNMEKTILTELIKNKNATIDRERLANFFYSISSTRSIDYHIKNIRKKINDDAYNPKYLKSEYGVGYRLVF